MSAEMKAELLPCPFCGGEQVALTVDLFGHADGGEYGNCPLRHTTFAFAQREAWNTRPDRDQALEEAAKVADDYSAEMDKPWAALAGMSQEQQVGYENHKYAGLNIATAIRALKAPQS